MQRCLVVYSRGNRMTICFGSIINPEKNGPGIVQFDIITSQILMCHLIDLVGFFLPYHNGLHVDKVSELNKLLYVYQFNVYTCMEIKNKIHSFIVYSEIIKRQTENYKKLKKK